MTDDVTNKTKKVETGVKLVGEVAFVPGASLLMDGNIKSGMLHVVAGLAARSVFGLPGLLVVAANSYSTSTTGRSLIENIKDASMLMSKR